MTSSSSDVENMVSGSDECARAPNNWTSVLATRYSDQTVGCCTVTQGHFLLNNACRAVAIASSIRHYGLGLAGWRTGVAAREVACGAGHARPSMAATSPADCECRSAVRAGRGGASLGSCRADAAAGGPGGQPVTNSCLDASPGVMRRLGFHLWNEMFSFSV
ncbi:hypothetical protein EVAR_78551_1 [Eumeta japonica]|uniref:Uncharacterized protein n=1 Tax=Eumeta variegata TaxID=151549 RepID=A0A4C1W7J0_EUMVA|nr:hypothetical protein EVAR_78551_1 [Eumeta japonica]